MRVEPTKAGIAGDFGRLIAIVSAGIVAFGCCCLLMGFSSAFIKVAIIAVVVVSGVAMMFWTAAAIALSASIAGVGYGWYYSRTIAIAAIAAVDCSGCCSWQWYR